MVYNKLNSAAALIQRTTQEAPLKRSMYYIGLDVHKKTISYGVKDVSGQIYQQGTIPATRTELESLGQDSSPALDCSDGSDDLHRLDLRSSTSACRRRESRASGDAARDCSSEKEKRSYRCQ